MTAGVDFMTGAAAAEATGLSIAEIDHAAATGQIPAHYTGWQLLVNPSSLMPPDDREPKPKGPKRKRPRKK